MTFRSRSSAEDPLVAVTILATHIVKSASREADTIAMGSTIVRKGRAAGLPEAVQLAAREYVDAFSAAAREMVARAHEQGRELGRGYVGTEHLVLAAFGDDGDHAGNAYQALGVRRLDVLESITRLTGPSGGVSRELPPMTPVLRRVLDAAADEARRVGESSVGPEHLQIAIAGERTCVGARVLADVGLDAARLRRLRLDA